MWCHITLIPAFHISTHACRQQSTLHLSISVPVLSLYTTHRSLLALAFTNLSLWFGQHWLPLCHQRQTSYDTRRCNQTRFSSIHSLKAGICNISEVCNERWSPGRQGIGSDIDLPNNSCEPPVSKLLLIYIYILQSYVGQSVDFSHQNLDKTYLYTQTISIMVITALLAAICQARTNRHSVVIAFLVILWFAAWVSLALLASNFIQQTADSSLGSDTGQCFLLVHLQPFKPGEVTLPLCFVTRGQVSITSSDCTYSSKWLVTLPVLYHSDFTLRRLCNADAILTAFCKLLR